MKRRVHYLSIIFTVIFCFFCLLNLGLFISVIYLEDEGTIARYKPITIDEQAPTIILNGEAEVKVPVGFAYEELGAEVYDNRSEPELVIDNEIDTNTVGEYEVIYSAIDEAGNFTEITRKVAVIEPTGIVYLTFDDGPGDYTAQLLDVLKKYGVKATFFVTGAGSDDMIRREYEEGHAVGLHTFSHNYSYIYSSTANFWEDLYKVQNRVESITGYKSNLIRFPGGSSNTVSMRYDGKQGIMSKLAREVEANGFVYFDWSITSGDAGQTTSTDVIYENVVNRLKPGSSIVLQHDIKGFSVNAVERIIQYGLNNGYVFMKLDASSPTAHHRINN